MVGIRLRLARRWENRLTIRARLRNGNPWIREPSPSSKERVDGEEEDVDEGPPLNMEFLQFNTCILWEMLDSWGLKPKIGRKRIEKDAGRLPYETY